MQLPICYVRILIFSFSLLCLTLDATALGIIVQFIADFRSYDSSDDLDFRIFIYSLINDLLSLITCGYYLIRIEYIWNNAPKIGDYIVCGIELVLWIIYVVLQSKLISVTLTIFVTFIYGILNIISYFALAILFFQFKRRLRKYGEDKLTPLSQMINNNAGVETNNAEVETNNAIVEVR
ncbi:hypothetical protein RclHR1_00010072 [Rhizophagus clarus]|uniref:Uncharacterized protein n=1 Tax=Rhizophagus clarus TaxID=94130 RepID=A0A2Z6Q0B2_9GLOM|nr:hypothetical protein RclHR1_00010072 [Rhizophagus clarus]GES75129.1 hypothetical protein GLOIN_2v1761388 [Rhizophagus clarus]